MNYFTPSIWEFCGFLHLSGKRAQHDDRPSFRNTLHEARMDSFQLDSSSDGADKRPFIIYSRPGRRQFGQWRDWSRRDPSYCIYKPHSHFAVGSGQWNVGARNAQAHSSLPLSLRSVHATISLLKGRPRRGAMRCGRVTLTGLGLSYTFANVLQGVCWSVISFSLKAAE